MFLQDSDIQTQLAAVLKTDASNLDPYWTATLIPTWHANAYQDIVTRLTARGFTGNQIASWDRGKEFESCLSLFWLLTQGSGLHDFDDRAIERLDRRKELDTMLITSQGIELVPGVVGEGKTVGSGVLNENMQGLQFRYGVGTGTASPYGFGAPYPWGRQIW